MVIWVKRTIVVLLVIIFSFSVCAKEFNRDKIEVGDKVTFELKGFESKYIRELGFSSVRSLEGVHATITENDLDDFELGKPVGGFHSELENIDKFDVSDAYVIFVVDGKWLKEFGIDRNDIELSQKINGLWTRIEAGYFDKHGKEFLYRASITDIGGDFVIYVDENKQMGSSVKTETKDAKVINDTNEVTGEAVAENVDSSSFGFNGIEIVVAMILGLIILVSGYVYLHRADLGKHDF